VEKVEADIMAVSKNTKAQLPSAPALTSLTLTDNFLDMASDFLNERDIPRDLNINGYVLKGVLADIARQVRDSIISGYEEKFRDMEGQMMHMKIQLVSSVPNAKDPKTGRMFRDMDSEE